MSPRAIATFCAIPSALFLLLIGVDSVLVNTAFSGAALSVLGLIVLLVLPGRRRAGAVATTIGLFVAVVGVAGYLWAPTKPRILVFLLLGCLLAAPLLIWRREFCNT